MANREMWFLQPLFGGFFRIAPLAQSLMMAGFPMEMVADGRMAFFGDGDRCRMAFLEMVDDG